MSTVGAHPSDLLGTERDGQLDGDGDGDGSAFAGWAVFLTFALLAALVVALWAARGL